VEQSSGRSWVFVGISREGWGLRDGTPPNKEKPFQTRKNLSKQGKTFPNKKNTNKQGKHLSSKENAFQARGIFQSNVKVYKW
jgi:hypothetical protein